VSPICASTGGLLTSSTRVDGREALPRYFPRRSIECPPMAGTGNRDMTGGEYELVGKIHQQLSDRLRRARVQVLNHRVYGVVPLVRHNSLQFSCRCRKVLISAYLKPLTVRRVGLFEIESTPTC